MRLAETGLTAQDIKDKVSAYMIETYERFDFLAESAKDKYLYDENGEVQSEETVYEDGTGTIVFHEDGSFTWHEDQAEGRDDMVFEWLPVMTANEIGLANPWREVAEDEAKDIEQLEIREEL